MFATENYHYITNIPIHFSYSMNISIFHENYQYTYSFFLKNFKIKSTGDKVKYTKIFTIIVEVFKIINNIL